MSLKLEVETAQLRGVSEQIVSDILRGATDTVHVATKVLERELEALFKATIKGNAWRVWKSAVYPRAGQPSYTPAGEVFANGNRRSKGMVSYWTQPGVNRPEGGQWLAIPLPAAGPNTRGRELTPGEWERRNGMRLQFVYTGRRFAMLVAVSTAAKSGRGVRKLTARRAAQGRDEETVPIFLLIPQQRHANRISLDAPVRRAHDYIARGIGREVTRIRGEV